MLPRTGLTVTALLLGLGVWLAPSARAQQPVPTPAELAPATEPATETESATEPADVAEAAEAAPAAPAPAAAPAQPTDADADADAEVDETPLPDAVMEAQGTCQTPRQAWLQLLYWLQAGDRWEPRHAAACFDQTGLSPERAGRLAEMLKLVLDVRPTWVRVDEIPIDPDHVNDAGESIYEEPNVRAHYPGVVVVKQADGRWLFSAETIERIPALYPSVTGTLERVLPTWARSPVLGVESWKYIAVLLLIFVAFTLQKLTVFAVGSYLGRGKTEGGRIKKAIRRADRSFGGLVMAAVFWIGFPILMFPPRVSEVAMVATKALAAFSVVWLGYRLIDVLHEFLAMKAEKTATKLDDQLVPMATKTLKVFITVVGSIFVLQNLNVNVGSLLAGLGLGGLAFALAARDTVANFFGSLVIFIDKPFQIGDWVVIADTEGIVEEVGFRTTKVRTFYNSLITVPNATLTTATVDNYGARKFRRYITDLGVTYDTPPETVQAFCEGIRAIIAGLPEARKDYYIVEFRNYGESALEILLFCFFKVKNWNEEMRARHNLNLEILRLAKEMGVSFAFPTRTLHVDTLANLGESRPGHSSSNELPKMAATVDAFAPGGDKARPTGMLVSRGYDNGRDWERTADPDAGTEQP